MKEKGTGRRFSSEETVAILRRHLLDRIPVSDLSQEHHIHPSLLYLWQRQALEKRLIP
jgi:transposase